MADEKRQVWPSLTFLLSLQAILSGLLAYLVVYTHTHHPEESRIWMLAKFFLAVCLLVFTALQALA
jgi:hypothetical protein